MQIIVSRGRFVMMVHSNSIKLALFANILWCLQILPFHCNEHITGLIIIFLILIPNDCEWFPRKTNIISAKPHLLFLYRSVNSPDCYCFFPLWPSRPAIFNLFHEELRQLIDSDLSCRHFKCQAYIVLIVSNLLPLDPDINDINGTFITF